MELVLQSTLHLITAYHFMFRIVFILGAIVVLLCGHPVHAQISGNMSSLVRDTTLRKLGDGFEFTEGPVADKKGNIYFTDQPTNRILIWWAKTGDITTFSTKAGRANGMYFDRKNRLIACADENNELVVFDSNGAFKVLVHHFAGKLLNGPNDVWVDRSGGIYFTDPLYKRAYWSRDPAMQQDGQHVYYLTPDQELLIKADSLLRKPNGIIGSKDGKKLFVADIGANKTYVYDIEDAGKISNRRLFVNQGSDGMTLDAKGNLYLTGRGVTVYNKNGDKIGNIPVGSQWTSNVCFGGKNKKLLFITSGAAVYGLSMKVKGM